MTDGELAQQLQTTRKTISKYKSQLVKSGYLKVEINKQKKTQLMSASFKDKTKK